MKYKEIHHDLITMSNEYYLAHCISADFAMGAGVAKKIDEAFAVRKPLRSAAGKGRVGECIAVKRIFNLVTKEHSYQKPTYATLRAALIDMRDLARDMGITKIAMPCIGCGLDKLNWNNVKKIIREVFEDTDLEIVVCFL